MKVEQDAILTCAACGVEGPHELLYLSEHLRGSRCVNCRYAAVYSDHLYADYARDVVGRAGRLPCSLAAEALRNIADILTWPIKTVCKPAGLLKEINQVASFGHSQQLVRTTRLGSSETTYRKTRANRGTISC